MQEIIIQTGQHVGQDVMPAAMRLLTLLNNKFDLSLTINPPEQKAPSFQKQFLENKKANNILFTGPLKPQDKQFLKEQEPLLFLSKTICYPVLADKSPLQLDYIQNGFDILFAGYQKATYQEALKVIATLSDNITLTEPEPALLKARVFSPSQIATQLLYNQTQFQVVGAEQPTCEVLSTLASELSGTPQITAHAWIFPKAMLQLKAGKGTANPMSAFVALSMLLRCSLAQGEAADSLEEGIRALLEVGARTEDLAPNDPFLATTEEFTNMLLQSI